MKLIKFDSFWFDALPPVECWWRGLTARLAALQYGTVLASFLCNERTWKHMEYLNANGACMLRVTRPLETCPSAIRSQVDFFVHIRAKYLSGTVTDEQPRRENKGWSRVKNQTLTANATHPAEINTLLTNILSRFFSSSSSALKNPEVVAMRGGLSTILKSVIDCQLSRINEALITTVLHLLNHPRTRQYVRVDVELEVRDVLTEMRKKRESSQLRVDRHWSVSRGASGPSRALEPYCL